MNGAAVVCHNVRHGASLASVEVVASDGGLAATPDLQDSAKLELGLLVGDAVDNEATLDVVQEAELLVRLLDGDHIHESSRVGDVGANLWSMATKRRMTICMT